MLVAVVGLFLLVELPLAVLEIVLMVDNTADLDLLDASRRNACEQLVNFFILLSYPLNFFIYCAMSRQFRDTFRGLFAPGPCCVGPQTAIDAPGPPPPRPGTAAAAAVAMETAKLDDVRLGDER